MKEFVDPSINDLLGDDVEGERNCIVSSLIEVLFVRSDFIAIKCGIWDKAVHTYVRIYIQSCNDLWGIMPSYLAWLLHTNYNIINLLHCLHCSRS